MSSTLTLRPIGYLTSAKQAKFDAPHQPEEDARDERSSLELLPDCNYEQALQDLAGFSRVWLIWWFHRNANWKAQVIPPRGPEQRRGVFATRSPHRPNPLGLTPVQLIAVEGRKLILGPCDLVDGTPVFDLKPYIPAIDSFPDARAGWHDEVDAAYREPPAFTVALAPLAEAQAEWLRENWSVDFRPRLFELLARDPSPHRTRRIKRRNGSHCVIGCGAWYANFTVDGNVVTVRSLEPAYPRRFLTDPARPGIPDGDAQLAFLERWPSVHTSGTGPRAEQ